MQQAYQPFAVGLTGGIASGKSYIGQQFQALGAHVIEADEVVRRLTQPGEPIYQHIVDHFGPQVLQTNKHLDRSHLRRLIFQNSQEKQWLENLIHPQVRQTMQQRMQAHAAPYHMLIIPLLIEDLPNPLIQRILVVETPQRLQLKRLVERDKIDEQLAQRMIEQQADPSVRRQYADDIIDNSLFHEAIDKQIEQLDQFYKQLANQYTDCSKTK